MSELERTYSRATSVVGGQEVGGDVKRRVYNFSLPFSNPLAATRFQIPTLHQLSPITRVKEDVVNALAWDDESTLFSEDELFRKHFVNPRTQVIKSQFNPKKMATGEPENLLPEIDGTVLFMGGYRGSNLRDTKTGRLSWIPIKVGLNIRKVNLELGLDDDAELNATKTLYPDGMLTHIGPLDLSRKLMRKLHKQKNCKVVDWGYDWRLDCALNSEKLAVELKKLHKEDPRGVIVIAHSMGGLVAHHALQRLLNELPESERADGQVYIRGIIYVGSPSKCPPILGPLRLNDPVMLAKDILSPKVNFTFRSSFVFIPNDGKCFVNRQDPTLEYDLDYWNVDIWKEFWLSPCVTPDPVVRALQSHDSKELDYDEAVKYLERTLKRAKQFKSELTPIKNAKYPPMAIIYGNTLPTVLGAKVDSKEEIRTTRYEDPIYGCGDGVVYRKNLLPIGCGFDPKEYDIEVIATPDGHIGLLSNHEAVGTALASILVKEGTVPVYDAHKTYLTRPKKMMAAVTRGISHYSPFGVPHVFRGKSTHTNGSRVSRVPTRRNSSYHRHSAPHSGSPCLRSKSRTLSMRSSRRSSVTFLRGRKSSAMLAHPSLVNTNSSPAVDTDSESAYSDVTSSPTTHLSPPFSPLSPNSTNLSPSVSPRTEYPVKYSPASP